ncbi:hypothetical protein M413DRAFT_76210 [Hebeloma cylindrosporum]|uniref:Uncharacterized protein n=1 Tax=Hebeloma cylindrosporum TaxID=76867 RepID=A0A0C2YB26_HEBCY|nr:hypothetical protein M413DRAFT_76210 [Hebeloma cylindrosporum h7]
MLPQASPNKPSGRRALKIEADNRHYELVLEAAQGVTEIFRTRGISCAVFGSLASRLYGITRTPKDVDLLVSQDLNSPSTLSAQDLKDLVLDASPRNFYLKLPRDPTASYRVLWYRREYLGAECKVDILIPGIMHLPHLPRTRVALLEGIPVVPFALLLLQKLQAWDDHCKSEESHKRAKSPQDAADVRKLMALRVQMGALLRIGVWEDAVLFSEEFVELTRERVRSYARMFPDRAEQWRALGFALSDPV